LANPFPNRVKLPTRHHNYSLALRKGHSRITKWLAGELDKITNPRDQLFFVFDILNVLNSRITLLQIDTESIPEAFDIFMSLNSTGLPLGPSDLVKTELFRVLTRDLSVKQREVRTIELTNTWSTISTNLDSGNIDQFLRHYLLSTQDEKVKSKEIFPKFESQISNVPPGKTPIEHAQEILETLLEASVLYEGMLECTGQETPEGERSLRTLLEIGDSYRVLLLAVLDPQTSLNDAEKSELILSLESFNMRWNLVGKNAQELESLYQKCANGLRKQEITVANVIERFRVEAPADEAVQATFQEPVSSTSKVKLILHRIEQHELKQVLSMPGKSLHIDWVAPQKDSPSWIKTLYPADTEDMTLEYEATVEQWGNKVILKKPVPVPAKAASFLDKSQGNADFLGYETSQFQTTRDIAKLSAWTRQEIKKRNKSIGEAVNRIWNL
jgi:hypothetical protein